MIAILTVKTFRKFINNSCTFWKSNYSVFLITGININNINNNNNITLALTLKRLKYDYSKMTDLKQIEETLSGVKIDLNDREKNLNNLRNNISNDLPTDTLEWPVSKVRSTFIDYFVKKHDHTFWPSSPVVPLNDPTLLFANSGMTQYKSLFLGTCDPSEKKYKLKMAVNSQKCIRAGGKHNDLDDVCNVMHVHVFIYILMIFVLLYYCTIVLYTINNYCILYTGIVYWYRWEKMYIIIHILKC